MTIKHFINNKRGLSTDTKPAAVNLFPTLFVETDTGRIITSTDGTTLTTVQAFDKSETKKNKTINVEKNTIIAPKTIEDNPFNTQGKIKGGHIPAASIPASFYGAMDSNDMMYFNALGQMVIPGIGLVNQYNSTVANTPIGFRTFTPQYNRSINQTFRFEVWGDTSRLLVGFSTRSQYDISLGLLDTDKGVVMGFTKVEQYFSVFNNDGTGTKVTTSYPTPKDSQKHIFEIALSPTNIICRLDDMYQVTLNTRIPSTTDPLYLIVQGIV